jgi:hypothetical protein
MPQIYGEIRSAIGREGLLASLWLVTGGKCAHWVSPFLWAFPKVYLLLCKCHQKGLQYCSPFLKRVAITL